MYQPKPNPTLRWGRLDRGPIVAFTAATLAGLTAAGLLWAALVM
jgi:hypothetical protein